MPDFLLSSIIAFFVVLFVESSLLILKGVQWMKDKTKEIEDEELVQRIILKEEAALEIIMKRWTGPLRSLVFKIVRSPESADEVVQDVFYKIWRLAPRYESEKGKFSSWVFSIAHHQAIDHLRGRRARGADLASTSKTIDLIANTARAPELEISIEEKYMLRKLLKTLPLDLFEVVRLSFYKGYTHEEAAKILDVPLGTVKTRLRLAQYHLRKNSQGVNFSKSSVLRGDIHFDDTGKYLLILDYEGKDDLQELIFGFLYSIDERERNILQSRLEGKTYEEISKKEGKEIVSLIAIVNKACMRLGRFLQIKTNESRE